MTSPVRVFSAAYSESVPWRKYSKPCRSALPGESGKTGSSRSSAWIALFSSTQNTAALTGGLRYKPMMSAAFSSNSGSSLALSRSAGESRSLWDQVKREPKRSTVPQFKDFLDHLHWLQQQNVAASAFAEIPAFGGSNQPVAGC